MDILGLINNKIKRRMKKLFIILILISTLISCTDNQRARKFGGTEEIKLGPNEELLNATWKETNLWILIRDKNTGVTYLKEKSSYGMVEGKIIFTQ